MPDANRAPGFSSHWYRSTGKGGERSVICLSRCGLGTTATELVIFRFPLRLLLFRLLIYQVSPVSAHSPACLPETFQCLASTTPCASTLNSQGYSNVLVTNCSPEEEEEEKKKAVETEPAGLQQLNTLTRASGGTTQSTVAERERQKTETVKPKK